MNDAEKRKQRSRISKFVTTWKGRLGLEAWHIVHTFYDSGWPDPRCAGHWATPAADCKADFRYMQAEIRWNLERVADVTDADELLRLIIHELTHCLTDPFKQYGMRELGENFMDAATMEQQTTHVEHALFWAWEAGIREGRRLAREEAKAAQPAA